MSDVFLVARLVLAAVFALAGWTKARDQVGTRKAVRDFGVPAAITTPVAFLLPVAELTVAFLLLFGATAAAGAVGAVILLALFLAGVGTNLARGERPNCYCFGRVRSETVSSRTLVRNGVLLGVALFVLARA